MLNKYKSQIDNMSKSLSIALNHLLKTNETELIELINEAVTAINNVLKQNNCTQAIDKGIQFLSQLNNPDNKESLPTALDEYLSDINNIPTTYKVVFIAELSSRWDTLESIYHQFAKDDMFETEIVIVPVVRRDKQWNSNFIQDYNDYLTPLGIPHTHYESYSLKNDKPDITFFCLPYDSDRPSEYHLANIRRHSGYMVYIPYAAVIHRFEEKHLLKHSEVMKGAIHVRSLVDAFIATGDHMLDDMRFMTGRDNKLIPLGSPKVDFLLNKINCEKAKYAGQEHKIAGKKTFFLNTHFRPGVLGDSGFYDLFEFIVDYFNRNEDIALIWRPHPNTFLFIKSHKPEYNEKLKTLMDKMENCPNIIIDTNQNHVAAYVNSHAVISHLSSIVSLAIAIDKPTFILDSYTNEQKEDTQPQPITYLPCFGLKTESAPDYNLIINFINDIKNDIDTHKEKRQKLCKYMFNNTDGTCGQEIYKYVKKEILK